MSWDKIIGTLCGWLLRILGYAVGNPQRDKKIDDLEAKSAVLEKELEILRGRTGIIENRVVGLESIAKDLYRRIDDTTDDLVKVRDRVLNREIKDEGERVRLRMQLERMVTDLDRLLTSIQQTRLDLVSKSKEQEVAQVLNTLLQISRGIGGKRRTINTLLNKLTGRPDDSNPPPVAA